MLIQTEYPEHPLLAHLLEGGYDAFAAAALVERARAGWPPFARLAVLRAEAARREPPLAFLDRRGPARIGPRHGMSRCWVQPPRRWSGAPVTTARNCSRTRRRIRRCSGCSPRWVPLLEALPEARKVRWALDVDPLELF